MAPAETASCAHAQQKSEQREEQQEKECESRDCNRQGRERRRLGFRPHGIRRLRRNGSERDAAIFGNDASDALREEENGAAIIADAQLRHGLAAKVADKTVWQNGLKTVANLDAILPVALREKDQDAAVFLFRADAPAGSKIDRIILDGLAIERTDSDDGDLNLGFLVHFGADGVQIAAGIGVDDAGKVVDIALRAKVARALGADGEGEQDKRKRRRAQTKGAAQGTTLCPIWLIRAHI